MERSPFLPASSPARLPPHSSLSFPFHWLSSLFSLQPSLSLSLSISLKLISLSLSPLKIKPMANLEHRQGELHLLYALAGKNQGMPKCRGLASFTMKRRHCWLVRRVTKPWGDAVDPPFSNWPTSGFGCKSVPCGLLIVMVASIHDESGQI